MLSLSIIGEKFVGKLKIYKKGDMIFITFFSIYFAYLLFAKYKLFSIERKINFYKIKKNTKNVTEKHKKIIKN